jgi:hypothetical protein
MPDAVSYPQAFNLAVCCNLGEEFIECYGSAIRWQDCLIDMGELMAFIEDKLNGR